MSKVVNKVKFWAIALAVMVVVAGLFLYPISPPSKESPKVGDVVKERVREVDDRGSGYVGTLTVEPTLTSENKGKTYKVLDLTDENTVELIGEVNDTSMDKLIADIQAKQGKVRRIYLLIDSPGGSVFAGARALATIQGSGVPVDTVCIGFCASMAAQLHAVGAKRYMTSQAVLMFHPASGGLQGDFNIMASRMVFLTKYFAKMDLYVADRAGIPYEEFKKRLRDEYWLDAEDATSEHFNDRIVVLDDARSPKILIFGSSFSAVPEESKESTDKYFKTH